MSDNKTIEQIRDNGSKRHCWPREQISDVYEYGYIAGFDASTAIHQEIIKKLVESLKSIQFQLADDGILTAINICDEALQEWEKK